MPAETSALYIRPVWSTAPIQPRDLAFLPNVPEVARSAAQCPLARQAADVSQTVSRMRQINAPACLNVTRLTFHEGLSWSAKVDKFNIGSNALAVYGKAS